MWHLDRGTGLALDPVEAAAARCQEDLEQREEPGDENDAPESVEREHGLLLPKKEFSGPRRGL